MGCDGGTIPTRDELVKTKQKAEQKDKDSVRTYKWQHCHLTQQRLVRPIVACELGRLYNKEAIIEKLLEERAQNGSGIANDGLSNVAHIRNLKDVKELELVDNPAYHTSKAGGPSVGDGGYVDVLVSPYICPVTGIEMNGKFRFVMDWSNGKVMSERAHKMLKDDESSRIEEDNLVILNPEENSREEDAMVTKMEARRAKAKAAKKMAKGDRKRSLNGDGKKDEEKKPKMAPSGVKKDTKVSKSSLGKAVTSSSVQHDPAKSEVYKSLFSTHKSAANKPKGHWVTFDPRYN